MTDLQIIGFPQSNFVWATRIAVAEKGLAHTLVSADPHAPEVAAIHPLGKVPVMRHGDLTLSESRAICGYVDQAFDGPALLPADPRQAARVEQWISIILTSLEPLLVRQYLFAYMFPGTPDTQPDRARIDPLVPKVERHLDVLERALNAGELGGESFTLADVYLVPILFYLRQAPESAAALSERPALTAYLARHLERPSVRSTTPPRMPTSLG